MKHNAFLSLGANIDDPKKNLDEAIECLKSMKSVEVHAVSNFYRTSPVDYLHQPDFFNCVVWVKTTSTIHKFFDKIRKLEQDLKPEKKIPKGPRRIDIDLLLFDDWVVITTDLTVPHPRMHDRRFVLVPLVEINENLIHPEFNQTVRELLNNLPDNPLEKVELYQG